MMTVYFEDSRVRLYLGDCRDFVRDAEPMSYDAVVTSPPYYGCRDNCPDDREVGKEESFSEYIDGLTALFLEIAKKLNPRGTIWINLADIHASRTKGSGGSRPGLKGEYAAPYFTPRRTDFGLEDGQLAMGPALLALKLQEAGLYVRNAIVVVNPSHTPTSAKTRFTRTYEMVHMFALSMDYHFERQTHRGRDGSLVNDRDVWVIPHTGEETGGHGSTFPIELPRKCISAGCPKDGTVFDPFMGTGTTGAAAMQLGRKFVGCELNPDTIEFAKGKILASKPVPSRKLTDFFKTGVEATEKGETV